jgi:hypothetical protein
MKDEIRRKHAIIECDHEIKFCKMVLENGATGDAKADAMARIKEAEKTKKKLMENK